MMSCLGKNVQVRFCVHLSCAILHSSINFIFDMVQFVLCPYPNDEENGLKGKLRGAPITYHWVFLSNHFHHWVFTTADPVIIPQRENYAPAGSIKIIFPILAPQKVSWDPCPFAGGSADPVPPAVQDVLKTYVATWLSLGVFEGPIPCRKLYVKLVTCPNTNSNENYAIPFAMF